MFVKGTTNNAHSNELKTLPSFTLLISRLTPKQTDNRSMKVCTIQPAPVPRLDRDLKPSITATLLIS